MMNALNKPWLTILTLAAVLALAYYSQVNAAPQYSADDRAKLDAVIGSIQYDETPESKILYLYGEQ